MRVLIGRDAARRWRWHHGGTLPSGPGLQNWETHRCGCGTPESAVAGGRAGPPPAPPQEAGRRLLIRESGAGARGARGHRCHPSWGWVPL